MVNKECNSCNKNITNDKSSVHFKCPNCGKYDIYRCGECRKNSIKYKCPECEFVGPN